VGTQPIDASDYCREIETYLCRKNDGHLIRVVGPSFEIVASWASQGVPLKVAFEGIDRYVERYYRAGPRRRPVKIDFCEADVLDVFDEWRRATGVSSSPQPPTPSSRSASLPEHLERVVTRLTAARASGAIGDAFDPIIDRAAAELDAARAKAGGIRGDARASLVARLAALDADLLRAARALMDRDATIAAEREADGELAPFRAGMKADAYARARDAAVDRLVRARFRLPIATYQSGE
jgi:hypothetical protein